MGNKKGFVEINRERRRRERKEQLVQSALKAVDVGGTLLGGAALLILYGFVGTLTYHGYRGIGTEDHRAGAAGMFWPLFAPVLIGVRAGHAVASGDSGGDTTEDVDGDAVTGVPLTATEQIEFKTRRAERSGNAGS